MEIVKDIEAYAWQFVDADGFLCITNNEKRIPKHHSALKKLIHLSDDAIVINRSELDHLSSPQPTMTLPTN